MPKHNRGMRKSVKGRLHMAAPHVGEFKIWLREGGYRETTSRRVGAAARLLDRLGRRQPASRSTRSWAPSMHPG